MRGLRDKKAIVTGSAQGIGRAGVESFIGYGYSAVFSDLDEDTGTATEVELRGQGADVHFLHGDMGDEKFCEVLVDFAVEKMSGIVFLINSAFSFVAAGSIPRTPNGNSH